eukprot:CAMPEP_0185734316 /NCGR_PEP_ID=MMETSP1171-20130828/22123_1 /TAXON_ID=374046 /ORGANISM="Helicotheca tamensis, Strain CCMP826" /LENGTH=636 /DNA_ID=CAMNT_0028404277 /DNA_START=32 /DNA_END=1942 /DNA_ORIENTATION=-
MFKSCLAALTLAGSLSTTNADWIDPDTPSSAHVTHAIPVVNAKVAEPPTDAPTMLDTLSPTKSDVPTQSPTAEPTASPTPAPDLTKGRKYNLVMSDEFELPGREFGDGKDPKWTALEKNDYTNDALHYYAEENVRTDNNGDLVITTKIGNTDVVGFNEKKFERVHEKKHFRSAMLQSWNKFCFTGGIVEAEVQLPGKHNVGGLWPAFWLLGNLARHTYVGSSMHMWPWSSTECNDLSEGAQKINSCLNAGHWDMKAGVGRGSPEIDIFEIQPGDIKANTGAYKYSYVGEPFMSASYQVAPGRPWNRPGPGTWPGPGQWYEDITGGNETCLNILFYGNYNHYKGDAHPEKQDYWSDAISYNRQLHEEHFTQKHVYRLEWDVPDPDTGYDGYLRWFLDNKLVLSMNGTGIAKAGFGAEISSEPMYILMNTAISTQWGFPMDCPNDCPCKTYDCSSYNWQKTCGFSGGFCDMMRNKTEPVEYKVNWVRVYQDPNDEKQKVGCSTPERPTRKFIEGHKELYMRAEDTEPLQKIARGGGSCKDSAIGQTAESCGGEGRGTCKKSGHCECKDGWVGPHCLVPDGSDPIDWEAPATIEDLGFKGPYTGSSFLLWALAVMALFFVVLLTRRKNMSQWTPIPDAA